MPAHPLTFRLKPGSRQSFPPFSLKSVSHSPMNDVEKVHLDHPLSKGRTKRCRLAPFHP